jgi:cytoskeletal protein CcmA (bactofilin family)
MKEKEKVREIVEESHLAGLIDQGTELKGELNFWASFRIEGYFQGKISSDSMLIIGEKGKVEAEVKVGELIINGEIHGNLQAKEKIEVHNRGRVYGTLIAPKLLIEEGSYLEANCQTVKVEDEELPRAAEVKEEKPS